LKNIRKIVQLYSQPLTWAQATLIFVESFGIQVGPLFRWAIYVIGFCI